jgi:hypothetical protein
VSQVIAVDAQTTWLVRREERDRQIRSRVYRVQVEP